ncbi:MAG: hypothetical protein RID91_09245 [Azospirillaceae bacterium]
MRRIHDSVAYDSERSETFATYEYALPGDDDHIRETLMRDPDGRYFLDCSGGGRSLFAEVLRDGVSRPGRDLIPLQPGEALRWMQDHDCVEAIEAQFPDAIAAGGWRSVVGVTLDAGTRGRATRAAAEAGIGLEAWIVRLVARAVADDDA